MAEERKGKTVCKMQLNGDRSMFSDTISNLLDSLYDDKQYVVTLMIEEQ